MPSSTTSDDQLTVPSTTDVISSLSEIPISSLSDMPSFTHLITTTSTLDSELSEPIMSVVASSTTGEGMESVGSLADNLNIAPTSETITEISSVSLEEQTNVDNTTDDLQPLSLVVNEIDSGSTAIS